MLRTKNPEEAQEAIESGKIVMADWIGRRVRINSLCHAEDQRWMAKWSHKDYIHAQYDDVITGQDEDGKYLPNGASAKAGLNKSILDAGWGLFVAMTSYKAANAGREVRKVNPRYTSQICSGCGTVRKKELSERWHSCDCGCELDRDHNAAINILRAGRAQHP